MQELAHWDKDKWKKLSFYANYFGLGSKLDGMDGSKVYQAWVDGEDAKIKEYCREDTLLVAKLYALPHDCADPGKDCRRV